MSNLILHPRVSEKAMALAESGVYVFDVPAAANKPAIARAVEAAFKVKVASVNVIVAKGKPKVFKRQASQRRDIKKALVKLQKGQTIKLFAEAK